jgi:RNA-binding protein
MITSKQRAYLRGLGNTVETILQIGKSGIGDTVTAQVDEALTARELVKVRVLETAPVTSREAAVELAERLSADVVQVIGTRFILYRPSKKNPVIVLK